jgi:hypothetical protein
MLGDNRDDSADSRFFGFVERRQIVGKVPIVVASYLLSHLQKRVFCDLCAFKLILGASPQTRLRGIEGGFLGVPAKTALNNPLEGTQITCISVFCKWLIVLPELLIRLRGEP